MLRQYERVLVISRAREAARININLKKIVALKLVVIGGFEPLTSAL